jgi:hypothetical protein
LGFFFDFEGKASLQSHEFLRIQILWITSVDSRETLASFRQNTGWYGPVTDTDENEGQKSPPVPYLRIHMLFRRCLRLSGGALSVLGDPTSGASECWPTDGPKQP